MYEFADTPPAKAIFLMLSFLAAFNVFSISSSVITFSKLAHKSALFISGVLWCILITAVFIPLKLKSKLSKCVFGNSIIDFPSFASLSTFGPPGYPSPYYSCHLIKRFTYSIISGFS